MVVGVGPAGVHLECPRHDAIQLYRLDRQGSVLQAGNPGGSLGVHGGRFAAFRVHQATEGPGHSLDVGRVQSTESQHEARDLQLGGQLDRHELTQGGQGQVQELAQGFTQRRPCSSLRIGQAHRDAAGPQDLLSRGVRNQGTLLDNWNFLRSDSTALC